MLQIHRYHKLLLICPVIYCNIKEQPGHMNHNITPFFNTKKKRSEYILNAPLPSTYINNPKYTCIFVIVGYIIHTRQLLRNYYNDDVATVGGGVLNTLSWRIYSTACLWISKQVYNNTQNSALFHVILVKTTIDITLCNIRSSWILVCVLF